MTKTNNSKVLLTVVLEVDVSLLEDGTTVEAYDPNVDLESIVSDAPFVGYTLQKVYRGVQTITGAEFLEFYKNHWPSGWWVEDDHIGIDDELGNIILDPNEVLDLSNLGWAASDYPEKYPLGVEVQKFLLPDGRHGNRASIGDMYMAIMKASKAEATQK